MAVEVSLYGDAKKYGPGLIVELRGEVAWIIIRDYQTTATASFEDPDYVHPILGLGRVLADLRYDPAVRVVVLTGENDGEFYRVARTEVYHADKRQRDRLNPLNAVASGAMPGVRRPGPDPHEQLALIEKPVIARLNGDAIGLGQAILWGCDIIVARDDAVVADVHTGQGEVVDSNGERRGPPWALTPGDGAMSYFALFLPPTKMKEFMLLSREWSTKDLAAMNVINYAVPAEQLDEVVDEIVQRLLRRPAYVVEHAKRVCNKHVIQNWNLFQDLAASYEKLDFWTHAGLGEMD